MEAEDLFARGDIYVGALVVRLKNLEKKKSPGIRLAISFY